MSEREFSYTQEVDKEEIMFFMEDEIIINYYHYCKHILQLIDQEDKNHSVDLWIKSWILKKKYQQDN